VTLQRCAKNRYRSDAKRLIFQSAQGRYPTNPASELRNLGTPRRKRAAVSENFTAGEPAGSGVAVMAKARKINDVPSFPRIPVRVRQALMPEKRVWGPDRVVHEIYRNESRLISNTSLKTRGCWSGTDIDRALAAFGQRLRLIPEFCPAVPSGSFQASAVRGRAKESTA
jgi:hypothetical protein